MKIYSKLLIIVLFIALAFLFFSFEENSIFKSYPLEKELNHQLVGFMLVKFGYSNLVKSDATTDGNIIRDASNRKIFNTNMLIDKLYYSTDSFMPLESLLKMDEFVNDLINEDGTIKIDKSINSLNTIYKFFSILGYIIIGCVRSIDINDHGNIFIISSDGVYDASYAAFTKSTKKVETVPAEISFGGKELYLKVLSGIIKYQTFNFKDKYLEDIQKTDSTLSKDQALSKYITEYGNYYYSILVSKYPIQATMDFSSY